ncbi:MAG: aminotransferase class I/II-fold pyridoxal phosphate-dependent enzyme, partial [Chloroflexota bacterium]|nr:aminotransferase class I/II-fold pyridoxal phosphate-dependent enzyme [Chloroflexota bacterium]
MSISNAAANINASPTLALNGKAKSLRAQGKPVINLSVGEPKNQTPEVAAVRAAVRLETRAIKYAPTTGTNELKAAIIQYTAENYGRTPKPENVVVTVGAKQALFNTLFTILDSQDEAILLAPYWVSYPEMIKMTGAKPIVARPQDGSFDHSLKTIESLVTERTKVIIVNSPNNPCGVIYSQDFIAAIVQFCEQQGLYLIMDDIYHKLIYGDAAWVPGYTFTEREIDSSHLIVVNGVSKTYGMTGFRIGWVIAPSDIARVVSNIQGQTTSGASIISQDAALGALTGPQDVVTDLLASLTATREAVLQALNDLDGVDVTAP